jgi:hypothetical protein
MTGKPMPENAMERMRMAPEVYQFTKNFAKQPNLLEKTGNLARSIGRGAVMAIGAPMVAEAVAAEADRKEMTDVTGEVQPEMSEKMQIEVEKTRREQIKNEGRQELQRLANAGVKKADLNKNQKSGGPKPIGKTPDGQLLYDAGDLVEQEKTTADEYNQDVIPQQTEQEQGQRSATQQAELETNQTIADNAAASQDFKPMFRPTQIPTMGALYAATPVVGEGLSESGNEINIIKGEPEEMVGRLANVTEAVDKFVDKHGGMSEQSKLDPLLLAAIQDRNKKERFYLGANSGDPALGIPPLADNPQTPPGQTNSAVSQPFAENIEPITNPSPNLTPQMQSVLNTLAKGRADLSQDQRMDIARKMISPNELAGKDQAAFEAITAGIPKSEQEAARNRIKEKTARKRNQSTLEKVEEFKSRIMPNKKSSFVDSMGLNLSADSVPTADFDIRQKGGGTKRYAFGLSSPMAVSLNEMVQDGTIKDESFGDLVNLLKRSKKENTGMAFDIGL